MEPESSRREKQIETPDQFKSHVVLLEPGPRDSLEAQVGKRFKIPIVDSRRWVPEGPKGTEYPPRAVIFEKLGVALINLPRKDLAEAFRDENVISDITLRMPGYELLKHSTALGGSGCRHDETRSSWGRDVTDVEGGQFTGEGVRVCVVDSGLAPHPHFKAQGLDKLTKRDGRAKAFVSNPDDTDDTWGHGTHCAGIICGMPPGNPLYSVAPNCELFVADVFGSIQETQLGQVIAGIEWALEQKCDIISMSLYWENDPTSDSAEQLQIDKFRLVVDRAMRQKALLLACTGNLSDRRGEFGSPRVENCCFPANQPNIIAVGAVDKCKRLFNTSNRGADIAGPGEEIISADRAGQTVPDSGTSMATAFVAGVAALHAQTASKPRGTELAAALLGSFTQLPGVVDPSDLKTGLVKAP